jgi:hypothetical protein
MKRHRSSRSYGTEIHRYFPEWADRPVGDGVLWESEQNSYSAGGYAEEFGYAAQPGLPAPAKHLNGDPECSKHWRTQIGALHPGYPECSRPLDRDIGPLATVFWGAQSPDSQRGPAIVRRGNRAVELAGGHSPYFQVIRPERHHSAPAHENVVRRLMLVWKLYFQLRHYRKLYGL